MPSKLSTYVQDFLLVLGFVLLVRWERQALSWKLLRLCFVTAELLLRHLQCPVS